MRFFRDGARLSKVASDRACAWHSLPGPCHYRILSSCGHPWGCADLAVVVDLLWQTSSRRCAPCIDAEVLGLPVLKGRQRLSALHSADGEYLMWLLSKQWNWRGW